MDKDIKIINKGKFQRLKLGESYYDNKFRMAFDVPQKLVMDYYLNDFPIGIAIKPYKMEIGSEFRYEKMPIEITNLGNGNAKLDIVACRSVIEFYPIGMGDFQLIKAELILIMKPGSSEITICEIDGSVAHLHYTIEVPTGTIKELMAAGMEFDKMVTEKVYDSMKSVENDIRKNLGLTLIK